MELHQPPLLQAVFQDPLAQAKLKNPLTEQKTSQELLELTQRLNNYEGGKSEGSGGGASTGITDQTRATAAGSNPRCDHLRVTKSTCTRAHTC